MAGVNLRVATLKNANLQNCDLRAAVLAGADLEVLNALFYFNTNLSFNIIPCPWVLDWSYDLATAFCAT